MFLRFYIPFLTLAMLLAVGSGCTSISDLLGFGYSEPKVSLRSIEIKNMSLSSIKMQVRLQVTNPNSFDLTLYKLDYTVNALGMSVAKGLFEKEFKVKAEGQGDIVVPLDIDSQSAFKLIKVVLEDPSDEHVAEIEATVEFDSPIGRIEHTFRDEKSLAKLTKLE